MPNHALQRTRRERHGCNCCVPCAGSLSLGRSASAIGCLRLPPQCQSRSALSAPAGFRRRGGQRGKWHHQQCASRH